VLRDFHRRVQLELWSREHAFSPGLEQPEDWPLEARLETGGLLPLWHGAYSPGLSATFAAVNGIRLLMAGHKVLTSKDEQTLLADAWRWRALRHDVMPDRGLRQNDWLRLVEAVCLSFGRRHDQYIRVDQPWRLRLPDKREFFTVLERLIVGRHVVLGLLAGANYTVVRGFTPTSVLLFDSGDQCWMKRDCVGLIGSSAMARHRVAVSSTLALSRAL
jgi:hypothetical protein